MKNIIFVWSDIYGFADNIKGLITCLIISKINNYNIKINCQLISSLHLTNYINSKYIDNFKIEYSDIKKFISNNCKTQFYRYVKNQYSNDIINKDVYIMTNIDPILFFFNNWDKNIESFEDCIFNDQINMLKNDIFLLDKIKTFVNTNYDVIHFRFGDKYMNEKIEISDVLSNEDITNICNFLNKNKISDNLIILSDNHQINLQIINFIKSNITYNIIEINNNLSIHFSFIKNHSDLVYILEDFMILKNASKVFGYKWSGFSFYGAMLGNQKYQMIN